MGRFVACRFACFLFLVVCCLLFVVCCLLLVSCCLSFSLGSGGILPVARRRQRELGLEEAGE
ncbi:MAG: hypothetical protein RR416_06745, partial [Clostridia bacterium]